MSYIACRHADLVDSDDLFQWRNDPQTRAASISTAEVSWNDHEKWFEATLDSKSRTIYIAIDDGGSKLGMCRFDALPEGTEVSINLNPAVRGRGLASGVLSECIDKYRVDFSKVQLLIAQIREENLASVRVFEKSGFKYKSSEAGVARYEFEVAK